MGGAILNLCYEMGCYSFFQVNKSTLSNDGGSFGTVNITLHYQQALKIVISLQFRQPHRQLTRWSADVRFRLGTKFGPGNFLLVRPHFSPTYSPQHHAFSNI